MFLQGKLLVYRHNDMQHLEELLRACPEGHRKLVVTDSLFSMDGRRPPMMADGFPKVRCGSATYLIVRMHMLMMTDVWLVQETLQICEAWPC